MEVTTPCTYWAFLTAGLLFPLHIVLGLASVPCLAIGLLRGSYLAWICLCSYLPFYLYPAQSIVPGWKWNAFWNFFKVEESAKSYNGQFDVHIMETFDPNLQYVIGVHPHGTMIFQRIFWLTTDMRKLFKRDYRMLCASVLFRIPLMREMTLFFGGVDAGKTMAKKILHAGYNMVLYPGGLDEANSVGSEKEVRLLARTGFIRMAVQKGCPVLPMFCFGELEAVRAVPLLPKGLSQFIKQKLKMSSTLFIGRWGTFIPFRTPFNLVVGKALVTKMCEEGAEMDEEVARVHAAYKIEVRRIFDANKARFGYAARDLVFTDEKRGLQKNMKGKDT